MRISEITCTDTMRETLREVGKWEMIADKKYLDASDEWKLVHCATVQIWHHETTSRAVIRFEYIPLIENNKHFEFALEDASNAELCAISILATILCHAHWKLEHSEHHGRFLESRIGEWSKEREEHRDEIGQAG